jgi:hypothetical protein
VAGDEVEHGGDVCGRRVVALLDGAGERLGGAVGDARVLQQVVRDGFGRHDGDAGMVAADRAFGFGDHVRLGAERGGVLAVGGRVGGVVGREVVGDARRHGLGGRQVVEHVLVGGLAVRRLGGQRVGVDGGDVRMGQEDVVGPLVVVAAVVDDQRRVGDRGGVGGGCLV